MSSLLHAPHPDAPSDAVLQRYFHGVKMDVSQHLATRLVRTKVRKSKEIRSGIVNPDMPVGSRGIVTNSDKTALGVCRPGTYGTGKTFPFAFGELYVGIPSDQGLSITASNGPCVILQDWAHPDSPDQRVFKGWQGIIQDYTVDGMLVTIKFTTSLANGAKFQVPGAIVDLLVPSDVVGGDARVQYLPGAAATPPKRGALSISLLSCRVMLQTPRPGQPPKWVVHDDFGGVYPTPVPREEDIGGWGVEEWRADIIAKEQKEKKEKKEKKAEEKKKRAAAGELEGGPPTKKAR
jgi:hypothetical protein